MNFTFALSENTQGMREGSRVAALLCSLTSVFLLVAAFVVFLRLCASDLVHLNSDLCVFQRT